MSLELKRGKIMSNLKLIGISAGRAKGNNEMLLRTALKSAKECCGAEVEMIRLHDLKIKDCIGCETCMRGLTTGGDGKCILRDDDFAWLSEAVKDADGLVLPQVVDCLIPD